MAAVLSDEEGDLMASSEPQLICQNGHSITQADIHPAFWPYVAERLSAREVQKPIHPDSCLICQSYEQLQREKVVPFTPVIREI